MESGSGGLSASFGQLCEGNHDKEHEICGGFELVESGPGGLQATSNNCVNEAIRKTREFCRAV